MEVNTLLTKLIKNSAILLSGNTAANILNFFSLALITRSIDIAHFGYFSLFIIYWEIVYRIFSPQSFEVFIQKANHFLANKREKQIPKLIKIFALFDFTFVIFGFFISYFFSSFFINFFEVPSEFSASLKLLCFTILTLLLSNISFGIFRLFGEFKFQALNTFILSFFKFLAFLITFCIDPSLDNFALSYVLSYVASFLTTFILIEHVLKKHALDLKKVFISKIDWIIIKELNIISTVIYQSFSSIYRIIPRQLDIVLLGKFSNPETIALFKVAKDISNILSKIFDSLYQSIYPEIARLFASNQLLLAKKLINKIISILFFTGIFSYFLFYTFGYQFIDLLFGELYLDSYYIILIFLIGVILQVSSLPLAPILYSRGLFKEAFLNMVISTVLNLLIMIILIYKYSAVGAALSFVLFYVSWCFLTLLTIKKKEIFK